MSFYTKITGIIGTSFRIGINSLSIILKQSSGNLALRDITDSSYVGVEVDKISIYDSADTRKIDISLPTGAAGNLTLNLPITTPASGEVLTGTGSGNTAWSVPSGGSSLTGRQQYQLQW